MRTRFFSVAEGRLWSRWLDVYWGPTCEEMFSCSWCVHLTNKLTITWNEEVVVDEEDAAPEG